MPEKTTISAIVITKNERQNIAECLGALAFCDEIVVVDSGSSDGTVEIARNLGAKVHVETDWRGFGVQKQRALDRATGDWVLSVDADERIPSRLGEEIIAAVTDDRHSGYLINRLSWFLGQPMRHGGWYPDRLLRLARRDKARFLPAAVHERLVVDGNVGRLKEPMTHYSYRSIDDVLAKLRRYALASAEARRRDGVKGGLSSATARALFAFAKAYFLQLGLLDGRRGFVAAVFRSQETFWRYLAAGWEKSP
ncbi:MAG: glycosyltransferase family 2 protein [Proteobacteria bacterium]|nr:glycosyltransferase family 2 protein [Pseudomonadota bacterium]